MSSPTSNPATRPPGHPASSNPQPAWAEYDDAIQPFPGPGTLNRRCRMTRVLHYTTTTLKQQPCPVQLLPRLFCALEFNDHGTWRVCMSVGMYCGLEHYPACTGTSTLLCHSTQNHPSISVTHSLSLPKQDKLPSTCSLLLQARERSAGFGRNMASPVSGRQG